MSVRVGAIYIFVDFGNAFAHVLPEAAKVASANNSGVEHHVNWG
jgi:hypothetical protein